MEQQKAVPLSQLNWKDYLARKNYNKDINTMCDLCKKDQVKKFGAITIKCSGLAESPKELIGKLGSVSVEDLDIIEQLYNPYYWAEKNIKNTVFKKRWYQEFMTRCTARNAIFRCGRRVGKSFGFALKALHRLFLNKEIKILMLAPAESQVKEFDEILKTLIFGFNPSFVNPEEFLVSSRKKPYYEMNFSNGSRFRGLIAANDAKTVRSQGAGVNVIILDEVDIIPDEALTAIMGVLLDNPDVELWVSSTPAGKAKLYSLENAKQYRTFHFPSFVVPHMKDDLEAELRTQYGSGLKWVHEVLAEYGTDDAGVFQGYFIDRCRSENTRNDFRDHVLTNRNRYLVILGVDWNDDKVGTRLVSVAFDREEKKFFTVDISKVSKDGWTQVEAVKKLIELNRTYKYDKMYLDEGYGVSTIQFIKQYAIDQYGKLPPDHPDLKLAEVVGINFSQTIEVKDPENPGKIMKKDMKSYIVDNTIRYLERLAYIFDSEYDKELIAQMENYIILRTSPSGRKVYAAKSEDIGDHDLDAFMLAMLGFNLEYNEIQSSGNSTNLMATVAREPILHNSHEEFYGIGKINDNLDSKFNNIFISTERDLKTNKNNDEFYRKYVLNSWSNIERGLYRKVSRSEFKK